MSLIYIFFFFFFFLIQLIKWYRVASKPRLYIPGLPECQPYRRNKFKLREFLTLTRYVKELLTIDRTWTEQ